MKRQEFVPLSKILLEDTDEIKKIRTLQQREEEYAYLLGPIEETIALHYSENKNLKDKDIVQMLKNLKINYYSALDFFKEPLEKEILIQLSFAAQRNKTTHREVFLAISYILWSIDNRTWTGDNRAYLDWILNFFGMMEADEKEEFQKKYNELGKKLGIDEEKIRAMTMGSDELDDEGVYEASEEENKWSEEDSKYFAMSDDEKCEYFLRCEDEGERLMVLKELMELSEQYLQNNQFEKSLNILNKLASSKLESGLKEVIFSLRIECLICLKQYEQAEQRIDELILQNKDYPMAYFNRAVILFKKGDLAKALEVLDSCIQISERVDMKHHQFYMMKADILKRQNNDDYKRFEKMAKAVENENMKMLKRMAEENELDLEDFDI